jgi:ribosome-associated translation inhibitor RaiA
MGTDMNLDIRTRGFSLTDALRTHCERQLGFALSRFGDRLTRVTVRLVDINGPHGGVDKRCSLVISLRGLGPVVVESTDVDLYAAISRSAERAGQAVARRVQHSHQHLNVNLAQPGSWARS